MTTIDWDDLRQQAAEASVLIPVGEYPARAVAATAQKTGTQKDAINVLFEILDGPCAGKQQPNLFTLSPESQNALRMWFKQLTCMGVDDAFFAQRPSMEQLANQIVQAQRPVKLVIEHDVWMGETRSRVKYVNALGATGAVAPPAPQYAAPAPPAPAAPQPPAAPVAHVPAPPAYIPPQAGEVPNGVPVAPPAPPAPAAPAQDEVPF